MCDIIIYSTTTGGTAAQKGEARAELLIKGAGTKVGYEKRANLFA